MKTWIDPLHFNISHIYTMSNLTTACLIMTHSDTYQNGSRVNISVHFKSFPNMGAVSWRILVAAAIALSSGNVLVYCLSQRPTMTRRTAMFWGAGMTALTTTTSQAPPVSAYERRDVGDETRSAEQAAYNLQAYETNNRLEREGFKLETQAEQKASLMAALSDYVYEPTATTTTKSRNSKGTIHSSRSGDKATK
jgi:hypothetical protein